MKRTNIEDTKLIFVGGIPRSGTTLVQKILDRHSQIIGGSEFHHIPDIINLRNTMLQSEEAGYLPHYCDREEIDEHIKKFIKNLLFSKYDVTSKKYFSEKTPQNSLVFNELLNIFPKAKFILVIRDPRGTIASMKRVKRRYQKAKLPAPSFVKGIKDSAKYIERHFKSSVAIYKQNRKRVLLIKYENLIQNSKAVQAELCNFLNLDLEQKMLSVGHHKESNPIIDNLWYTDTQYNRKIDTSSIDKWKTELSRKELNFINNFFRNNRTIKSYGYSFDYNFCKYSYLAWKIKKKAINAISSILKKVIYSLRVEKFFKKMIDFSRHKILDS